MDVKYGASQTAAGMTNNLHLHILQTMQLVQFTYNITSYNIRCYFFGLKSTSATSTPWYLSLDD